MDHGKAKLIGALEAIVATGGSGVTPGWHDICVKIAMQALRDMHQGAVTPTRSAQGSWVGGGSNRLNNASVYSYPTPSDGETE